MALWGIWLFGLAGLVHADVVQDPGLPPGCDITGAGTEACLISGSVANSNPSGWVTSAEGQFDLPQFDPALGSLSSLQIGFSNASFSADAGITFTCPQAPGHCIYGFSFFPVLSASAGALDSFTTGMNVDGIEALTMAVPSPMGPITYTRGVFGFGSYPAFNPPPPSAFPPPPPPIITGGLDPFIGTGDVTFDAVETEEGFISNAKIDEMSISANYQVTALYDFTPAIVPEPSLLLATAALFGLIVVARRVAERQ